MGIEALSRWNNSDPGNVHPEKFRPVAEDAAFIIEIETFVLNKACNAFSLLPRGNALKPSINFSYWTLMNNETPNRTLSELDTLNIKLESLIIEITETTLIQNEDDIIININKLSKSGVHIAPDDFGTDYSSFSVINTLPISTLKIDKSFVSGRGNAKASIRLKFTTKNI